MVNGPRDPVGTGAPDEGGRATTASEPGGRGSGERGRGQRGSGERSSGERGSGVRGRPGRDSQLGGGSARQVGGTEGVNRTGSGPRSSGRREGARPASARPAFSSSEGPLAIPDDVVAADLDRAARSRLRTLSKDNADGVARHLVMAGRLLEDEPELALAHALEAVRRAGRVDVVREAAGIAAYRSGRYADALRELRAARRLNGSVQHVPLMVDCERGLGRPERALAVAQEHQGTLTPDGEVELAIVVSGARMDLGQPEAALAALSTAAVRAADGTAAWRVAEARVAVLHALGRAAEAEDLAAVLALDPRAPNDLDDEEIVVVDLEDEDGALDDAEDGAAAATPGPGGAGPADAAAGPEGAEGSAKSRTATNGGGR